jgi:hypothetical protein
MGRSIMTVMIAFIILAFTGIACYGAEKENGGAEL